MKPLLKIIGVMAALGIFALIAMFALLPWMDRWGASQNEIAASLPGDELVPEPAIESTRAITVNAPVEEVWPWLAQIGQDRRLEDADHVHLHEEGEGDDDADEERPQ